MISLGLTEAMTEDAGSYKKILVWGVLLTLDVLWTPQTTTLIILNVEMEDIMKIVKSVVDFGLFIKEVTKTVENETKKKRGGFLGRL